jgi:hypothetical protein
MTFKTTLTTLSLAAESWNLHFDLDRSPRDNKSLAQVVPNGSLKAGRPILHKEESQLLWVYFLNMFPDHTHELAVINTFDIIFCLLRSTWLDTTLTCSTRLDTSLTCSTRLCTPMTCSTRLDTPLTYVTRLDTPLTCSTRLDTPLTCSTRLDTPLTCSTDSIRL